VERRGKFGSRMLGLFSELAGRGVALRLPARGTAFASLPRVVREAAPADRGRARAEDLSPGPLQRPWWSTARGLYFGSANLTGAGLGAKGEGKRNFELGLCTEDFETVDRIQALFDAVWSGAECASCKLRSICPDPIGQPERKSLIRLGRARRFQRVGVY